MSKPRRARTDRPQREPSSPKAKKQAALLCCLAVVAAAVMLLLLNPFNGSGDSTDTDTATRQSQSTRSEKKKATTKKTGTLERKAEGMFTGDAEQIADEARDLLNAPADSNVDTLSNLLYRHGEQDLAEATDLYDAIGSERDIKTIRRLARQWYPQAMRAAIEARRTDLSSGLDDLAREVKAIDANGLAGTEGCGDMKGAYRTAKKLVTGKSNDYDALTKAQQDLTAAVSGCATNLGSADQAKVFGQPQGTLKEDGGQQ